MGIFERLRGVHVAQAGANQRAETLAPAGAKQQGQGQGNPTSQ